jgi:hypothetical protein
MLLHVCIVKVSLEPLQTTLIARLAGDALAVAELKGPFEFVSKTKFGRAHPSDPFKRLGLIRGLYLRLFSTQNCRPRSVFFRCDLETISTVLRVRGIHYTIVYTSNMNPDEES